MGEGRRLVLVEGEILVGEGDGGDKDSYQM